MNQPSRFAVALILMSFCAFSSTIVCAQDPGSLLVVCCEKESLEIEFADDEADDSKPITIARGEIVRLFEHAPNFYICYYHGKPALFPVDDLKTVEEAREHFAEQCESNPSANNFAFKANCENILEDYKQALKDIESAQELDASSVPAQLSLASIYFGMDKYAEAEEIADQVLANENNVSPQRLAQACSIKASVSSRFDREPESVKLIDRAIEFDPYASRYHANKGYFLRVTGTSDGADAFRKSIELDPMAPHGYFRLAYYLYNNDEFEEAKKLLLKAAEYDPKYEYAQEYLGYIAQKMNDPAEYVKRMILTSNARRVDDGSIYGCAWMLATHPNEVFRNGEQAKEFAEKILRRTDDPAMRANALIAMAAAYAELGEFKLAKETLDGVKDSLGNQHHFQRIAEALDSDEPCRDQTFSFR